MSSELGFREMLGHWYIGPAGRKEERLEAGKTEGPLS